MEKTEAESVEDMTAAIKRASVKLIAAYWLKKSHTQYINMPVNNVVKATPKVAKIIPFHKTGLISANFVSMQPENRKILKANIPIN